MKPFAALIKKINDAYIADRKKVLPVKGLSEKFTCKLCDGAGVLMIKSTFSKLKTPTNHFFKRDGSEIVAHSLCECPTCKGSGLDSEGFLESLDGDMTVGEICEAHDVDLDEAA